MWIENKDVRRELPSVDFVKTSCVVGELEKPDEVSLELECVKKVIRLR